VVAKTDKNKLPPGERQVARNAQAGHLYEIHDRFEAGLVLLGTEVKSAREGGVTMRDAYVSIRNAEAWLMECNFAPYSNAGYASHEPRRPRKLLLHRAELKKLHGRLTTRGYTAVALRMYTKSGNIKVEIALATGKKLHDKREVKKRKAVDREIARELANR